MLFNCQRDDRNYDNAITEKGDWSSSLHDRIKYTLNVYRNSIFHGSKQGFFHGGGYNLHLPSIKRLQKPAIKVFRR